MKLWVGVTDNDWFDFLSRGGVDEVNFWQPSSRVPFVRARTRVPILVQAQATT